MRISAKIDYGCRALLELSLHWPDKTPLQVSVIAERQNIPIKFLIQILLNLKQLGYVQSVRGKNGGYLLARLPREIQLSQVINQLGGIGYSITDDSDHKGTTHVMDIIWSEIDQTVLRAMDQITFETICIKKKNKDKVVMFHI